MKNRILLTLVFGMFALCVSAQTPESVVREYVRLMNDWSVSPYDTQKREQVASILKPFNKKCTFKDKVVALYLYTMI